MEVKEIPLNHVKGALKPGYIPIMEHFYTLQGEGHHSGIAAYFIRLAGCDVGCVWCDVKESWAVEENQIIPIESVIAEALKSKCKTAVITGGEPLMYDLSELTDALKREGFKVHIETSGSHKNSGVIDWYCLSPKKFKQALPEAYAAANELKVIVYNSKDFEWAEKQAASVGEDCMLYLQPEWSKRDKMMPRMVDYVKQNPKWRISLQTHKYLHIP